MRRDQQAIIQWVPKGARVLDLGCGDGTLLRSLWKEREAPGYGVEIGLLVDVLRLRAHAATPNTFCTTNPA